MGPLLLARLMNLNEVQEGVLTIAFTVADKEGLMLLDLDDLQAMLVTIGERADELTLEYGNVSKMSVGAIQRSLLQLRAQGGDHFFGEPALDLEDFLKLDDSGQGDRQHPRRRQADVEPAALFDLPAVAALELFELLPEIGDPDKPKLAFFFDEAHLLFEDAPPALQEKIEQVVRLIRSKGVGVYFITQNPIDIPDKVAGQLGNRVQHALRAFTPRDQAAVKSAAETFRPTRRSMSRPRSPSSRSARRWCRCCCPTARRRRSSARLIKPPRSRVGPLTAQERAILIQTDAIGAKYDALLDRDSAEEILKAKGEEAAAAAAAAKAETEAQKAAAEAARQQAIADKEAARQRAAAEKEAARQQREAERLEAQRQRELEREEARRAREAAKPTMADKMIQSAGRSIASSVGRQLGNSLLRGIFGGLLRGR